MPYDFEGWATKNDLKCSDGVIIRKGAFEVNNGKKVPLVWNHQHNKSSDVLGHAILENREEGVYAYCSFNNTPSGRDAKEAVQHGDVTALSIWANNLHRVGDDILHGVIREVSLVLAGANPGAFIESVIHHSEPMGEEEDEGLFYTNEGIFISHDGTTKDPKDDKNANEPDDKNKPQEKNDNGGKTVQEVLNDMSDEQKAAVGIIVEQAIKDSKNEPDKNDKSGAKEDEVMHYNLFEGGNKATNVISHSDMEQILKDAKQFGTLSAAVEYHLQDGVLKHSIDTTGMETATGTQTYGFDDPSMLFPDYKAINNQPEWISRNMDWVGKLMKKVHHTPFSRIKSLYANITEDEARAKGYIKGNLKKEEVFSTLKRTTDPQLVFKKQKLDRDDIIDITDFDVIAWIKAEMRIMLDEEIARAILIGDGRPSDSEDKIKEDHIRPVAKDVPLYNTVIKVTVPSDADEGTIAKETIKAIIRGRKRYKGSGKPDFWTTEDVTTEMLLLEDGIGHAMYKTETELATKLRVNEIIPVEPMEGQTITITENGSSKTYPLIGVITNMADYNVGANKGGEVTMFDGFDIDYNQQKYLIETKISGALIKPFSALTIVLDKIAASTGGGSSATQQSTKTDTTKS